MQGWIRRARDLGIISEDVYRTLKVRFHRHGRHREEPLQYTAGESRSLFRRLVLRARGEEIITSDEAVRLRPGVSPTSELALVGEMSLRELARRPRDERRRVVLDAAIEVDPDETEYWDAVASDVPD